MSTNVIISFTSRPDMLEAFAEIMRSVKRDLPSVAGCIDVSIFNDQQNPCVFTLVETWDSEIAHKKHIEGVVSSGGWSYIASHLACAPTSSYFKSL